MLQGDKVVIDLGVLDACDLGECHKCSQPCWHT